MLVTVWVFLRCRLDCGLHWQCGELEEWLVWCTQVLKSVCNPCHCHFIIFCAFCRILFRQVLQPTPNAPIMTELVNIDCCCFVVSKWGGGIDWWDIWVPHPDRRQRAAGRWHYAGGKDGALWILWWASTQDAWKIPEDTKLHSRLLVCCTSNNLIFWSTGKQSSDADKLML